MDPELRGITSRTAYPILGSAPTRFQVIPVPPRHGIGSYAEWPRRDSGERLAEDAASGTEDEEAEAASKILYRASFQELMPNYLQHDMIIWAVISLVLVLAWGGWCAHASLPAVQKICAEEGHLVTENKIVYKASRPSYLPFMGIVKKEINVPLRLVIDIIIEQGCLQSAYSLYTFRVESIAHGKPAPLDELQFHGVYNPDRLKKVITREASERIQEVQSWKPRMHTEEDPLNVTPISRIHSPSASVQIKASARHALLDSRAQFLTVSCSISLLGKVSQSVKIIESLLIGSHSRE